MKWVCAIDKAYKNQQGVCITLPTINEFLVMSFRLCAVESPYFGGVVTVSCSCSSLNRQRAYFRNLGIANLHDYRFRLLMMGPRSDQVPYPQWRPLKMYGYCTGNFYVLTFENWAVQAQTRSVVWSRVLAGIRRIASVIISCYVTYDSPKHGISYTNSQHKLYR